MTPKLPRNIASQVLAAVVPRRRKGLGDEEDFRHSPWWLRRRKPRGKHLTPESKSDSQSLMLAGRRIAVVMPAYNEAQLIRNTLEGVPEFVDHIIVVDDASVDGTVAVAQEVGRLVEVVEHGANEGVGSAIGTGCERALRLDADVTAIMAADGQMDPRDLQTLLEPLLAGNADFVKGNRLDWPGAAKEMPWHRWIGNHFFSWLTGMALGVSLRDSQCGYVAMNRRTSEGLGWDKLWKGYGYPNDLLSRLRLRGSRLVEVPVRPVYGSEQSGIRLRHVMFSIPFVIARGAIRRIRGGTTASTSISEIVGDRR